MAGVVAVVREALSDSHRDYTTGNIGRLIVLLAIPMVLEMLMESLFGIVDIYFVARLGADAVATVMLSESALVLVFGVVYWIITLIPLPPPFKLVAQVVLALILLIVLIDFLLGGSLGWRGGGFVR